MCIMNPQPKEVILSLDRFSEELQRYRQATEVPTGKKMTLSSAISIPPNYFMILELSQ